jgi:hypothetical protein
MLISRGSVRAAAAFLGAWGVASCGDPSAPTINPVDYLLAQADGSWSNSAAAYMALAYTPSAPVRAPAETCKYASSKSAFVCPQRIWNGLSFDLSYQLLTPGNSTLSAYDAKAVASVRTMTAVSGTLVLNATTSQVITSSGDRILSGLLGGDPTVNGTEVGTYIYNAESFHDTTYTVTTISNFKVPPRNSPTFPTGEITTNYHANPPTPGATPVGTFTMTFTGSHMAKMVWTFSGFSVLCTFDLKSIQTVCDP